MEFNAIDTWVETQKTKSLPLTDSERKAWRQFLAAPLSEVSHHARQIALPVIKPLDDPDCRITQLWTTLEDAVSVFTDQNDKFVDFVLELQRLPDGKGVLGPETWFDDLPLFNDHWTEWVQFQYSDAMNPEREARRQAFTNQNAFLAKITARAARDPATKRTAVLDQRERGGEVIVEALEETPWDEKSPTYDAEGDKVAILDAYIPAAAQWLKFCAEGMYEKALSGQSRSWEYPYNETNWGAQKGWSKERWDFWRKRFLEISEMPELKEETRLMAKECVDKMIEVEKSK
ncbi:hypothetical protein GGR54DRAFT_204150 [Hypoxylon sp. NC1633]|nr:hypothetical protein GGR54DRAFT_204150 [Hypoxylon sp. NC1633]